MKQFREKLDRILWAVIWLLPVLAYFIQYYRSGTAVYMMQFIDEQFSFDFIKTLINSAWSKGFGGEQLKLAGYLSYLVAVEIAHCLFDVVVFIPRFAQTVCNKAMGKGEKTK